MGGASTFGAGLDVGGEGAPGQRAVPYAMWEEVISQGEIMSSDGV